MDLGAVISSGLLAATGPTAIAYAIAAVGLNLHFGYTGLLNFGHVAFLMVGAYGVAITVDAGGPLWLGVIMSIVAAIVLALMMGIPTLRLRAEYLAIVTIAIAEVLRLLIRSSWAQGLTGGVFGIQGFAGDFHALSPLDSRRLRPDPVLRSRIPAVGHDRGVDPDPPDRPADMATHQQPLGSVDPLHP
jgi:neutral amino acid transport system permease protein